jgi:phytoene dehydrogenase-like protein
MSAYDVDVAIVGAGLAGLAAAIELSKNGKSVRIFEASDGIGGRVRTDLVDGFLLDRGFQVMLAAYPEAKRLLNYSALNLCSFDPGALVQLTNGRALVSDPFRRPLDVFATAKAPVGSLIDKAKIAKLRHDVKRGSLDRLWAGKDEPTIDRLRAYGFSSKMIESFLRPLFAGVSLDNELTSSSLMFDFVFRMLGEGNNVVPANGMHCIPQQLAAQLPAEAIQMRSPVSVISAQTVTVGSGADTNTKSVSARNVIVATEGPAAVRLLATAGVTIPAVGSQPVSCVYFSVDAEAVPFDRPIIVLNGIGPANGPITNMTVMSNVSAAYAPPGQHLVSVSAVGPESPSLETDVRDQLVKWFGPNVSKWDHLRTYHIVHAQPSQKTLTPHERAIKVDGMFVAGDHRDQASIQGALLSGTRCAQAVLRAQG